MAKPMIQKLVELADFLDKRGFTKEADAVDRVLLKRAGYTLTLTKGERDAIDWVGNRNSNGDELYKALWGQCSKSPDDADWDDPRDITFSIPEHVAWGIKERAEEEDGGGEGNPVFPHFSRELEAKMIKLCDNII